MNDLTIIERQLQHVEPQLHNALSGIMPTKRLIQTVLISCERTPKLLNCRPQSILNGAMTFAVLGLPVDGATGQGFLLPFKDIAQAAIGYKGYNTLGARAGLTITGAAVREDDHVFDYQFGDKAFVTHKPRLGSKGRIIAFWAVAVASNRPPIVSVLSIDDVLAIKAKSPAVKANADTPWNDPTIGFPAMGEKSAKRRLSRSTPLITEAPQFMMAARMEEAFDEQARASWITPERGVVVNGEARQTIETELSETPTSAQLIGSASPRPETADREPAPSAHPPIPAQDGAGEVTESEQVAEHDRRLAAAAEQGTHVLEGAWNATPRKLQRSLKMALDRRHKPRATEVDDARQ